MPRTITIPQREVRQDIHTLEEFPPRLNAAGEVVTPGSVNVTVGAIDDNGQWIESTLRLVVIALVDYDELCADEPPDWAPDKPAGTYRNDDLWHFIDLQPQA
jgi:hypothetical protein